jgi:hypothetical protein
MEVSPPQKYKATPVVAEQSKTTSSSQHFALSKIGLSVIACCL